MSGSRMDPRDYTLQLRAAMRRYLPWRGLALLGPDRWSDRLLVLAALLMVFSGLSTLRDRFGEARAAVVKMSPSRRRPGTSYGGFSKKLRKHSARLLDLLVQALRQRLIQSAGAHWKVGRFLAFGVDGTKADAPRTLANQKHLKIGGKHKSGPQQLLVTLMHVGTGLLDAVLVAVGAARGTGHGDLRGGRGTAPGARGDGGSWRQAGELRGGLEPALGGPVSSCWSQGGAGLAAQEERAAVRHPRNAHGHGVGSAARKTTCAPKDGCVVHGVGWHLPTALPGRFVPRARAARHPVEPGEDRTPADALA